MSFIVEFTNGAREDLARLYQHLLERAQTIDDLGLARRALDAIADSLSNLERSPFLYRKAAESPFLRELLVPFGSSGYVLLYEIKNPETVDILAVRHQLEDDYH